MDLKREGKAEQARAAFEASTAVLEAEVAAARCSERTTEVIRSLDYEALRARREANSRALRNHLAGLGGVAVVAAAQIPSHLVVSVGDAAAVQAKMARQGVFCPIHWPRPERLRAIPRRVDLLSLPLDHRYDPTDMERVASTLKAAVRQW
jgi:hypothetical protein